MLRFLQRRKRVLLLDDDPSMQRLVTRILTSDGFRVEVFLTGREAIAAVSTTEYDVLLLDLMMPHEGGMTVIRHLREQKPQMLQRAVVLTGSPESVTDTIGGDVEAIVRKPFRPQELIDVVRRVSGLLAGA